MKTDYHLALLHFVHMLINTDNHIDDREMDLILTIQKEEKIEDAVFKQFSKSIANITSREEIYDRGLALLNNCTDEEKLCAFVYLFQLAEADTTISMKETRLLINALNEAKVDFNDVDISNTLAVVGARSK